MSISKERWIKTGDPRSGNEVYDDEGFEVEDDTPEKLRGLFASDDDDEIDAYCTNCHWHGLRTSLVRHESEPNFPPRCCPKCKEESIEDFENIGELLLGGKAMCRCGHEFNYHAPMDDEGQPTKHQPCHGYGCECGKFEGK